MSDRQGLSLVMRTIALPTFFDIDFYASELKIFRQNNNLVSAISDDFGSVHDITFILLQLLMVKL